MGLAGRHFEWVAARERLQLESDRKAIVKLKKLLAFLIWSPSAAADDAPAPSAILGERVAKRQPVPSGATFGSPLGGPRQQGLSSFCQPGLIASRAICFDAGPDLLPPR
jgi:hypothetical protein